MSCWIGEQLALILFFYVPVAIMLLFNAVSLIWTIYSIHDVTKVSFVCCWKKLFWSFAHFVSKLYHV